MVWETASFIPSMGGGHGPGSTPYTSIHTGLQDTLDMAHWARVAGELKELEKYVHICTKRGLRDIYRQLAGRSC
jgi:hypothetical protein